MALLQPVCNLSGFITFRSTTQDFRLCALFTTRLWLNEWYFTVLMFFKILAGECISKVQNAFRITIIDRQDRGASLRLNPTLAREKFRARSRR